MLSDSEKNLSVNGTRLIIILFVRLSLFQSSYSDGAGVRWFLWVRCFIRMVINGRNRDQTVDNLISFDFVRKGGVLEVHEVKKSRKMSKSHHYQLLYYLYYLKSEKGINDVIGIIDYPKIRRREILKLDDRSEREIENIVRRIGVIFGGRMLMPREVACLNAYYELCFV